MNPVGLGHQPEQGTVGVETPRPPFADQLNAGFVVAIQKLAAEGAGGFLVRDLDRV